MGVRESEDEMRVSAREKKGEVRVIIEVKGELICGDTHKGRCEPPYARGFRSR